MNRLATASAFFVIAACSTTDTPPAEQPAPPPPATATAARDITKRDKLPEVMKPALPKHGIYAAGGGFMSSPWRVVVDLDAKTIYVGTSQGANKPSHGTLERETTKELSPRNGAHLMSLAHAAWVEQPPREPASPIADYNEVLVVLEGDDTFYLEGYGPIRRPEAAKLITELRAAAGL